jgi:hypothetical protein
VHSPSSDERHSADPAFRNGSALWSRDPRRNGGSLHLTFQKKGTRIVHERIIAHEEKRRNRLSQFVGICKSLSVVPILVLE